MNLRPTTPQQKELMEFYDDRMNGRLTQEQLKEACHFWTVKYAMDSMKYEMLPSEPIDVRKWLDLTEKQRLGVDEIVRRRCNEMAAGYWGVYSKAMNTNRTHLTFLMDVANTMRKYKNHNLAVVEDRINEFKSKGVKPWGESLQEVA